MYWRIIIKCIISRNLKVNATSSLKTLNIKCNGEYACYNATINASNAEDRLIMLCKQLFSCRDAHIYCPKEAICDIDCLGTKWSRDTDMCRNAQFYVANKFLNKLDLNCDTSGCASCRDACSSADIVCLDTGLSSSLYFDSGTSGGNVWKCDNYGCCTIGLGNIMCTAGVPCQIDCDKKTCSNSHIDATLATSLTIDCGSTGCEGALIDCPNGTSASCTINCPGSRSCKYVYIRTGPNTMIDCRSPYSCQYMHFVLNSAVISNVSLNCNADHSCSYSDLSLNSAEITNLDLNCIGYYSCYYLDLSLIEVVISTVSLQCGGEYSCFSLHAIGSPLINSFHVDCKNEKACSYAYISSKIDQVADIDCIYKEACSYATFDLVLTRSYTNVNITCVSSYASKTYSACYRTEFNIGGNNDGVKTNNISYFCGSYDCYYATLNSDDFYRFDVDCSGLYSCGGVEINGATSTQVNLHCNDEHSCANSVIYCPYNRKDACNIDCKEYTYSCYNMDIMVPPTYTYNYLDITCPSYANSTTDSCNNLDIICSDGKSAVALSWDDTKNEHNCGIYSSSSYCCPFFTGNIISCNNTLNCSIDCGAITPDCDGAIINGSTANFLTVQCRVANCEYSAMGGAVIYCPAGGCDIRCGDDDVQCQYAKIIAEGTLANNSIVSVSCAGRRSCKYAEINYMNTFGDNGNLSVECGPYSCYYLTVNAQYANEIDISCKGDKNGCYYATFNGQNANKVTITTEEQRASYHVDYNFNNATSVLINVRGDDALYKDTFHVENASLVVITCSSDEFGIACNNVDFYVPWNTIFNCYGNGCDDLGDLYFNTNASG
eukprot:487468_1